MNYTALPAMLYSCQIFSHKVFPSGVIRNLGSLFLLCNFQCGVADTYMPKHTTM